MTYFYYEMKLLGSNSVERDTNNDKDDASSDNNDTSDDDDMDDMDAPPLFMKAAPVTQPLITTTMPIKRDQQQDVTLTDEHLCYFTTGWKILRRFPVWHEDKNTGWIPELGGYYMDGNQLAFGSFRQKSLGKRSLQQIYENNGVPDKFPSDSNKPYHTPTINIKDSPVLALAASVKVLGDLYTTYWIFGNNHYNHPSLLSSITYVL
ncbi:hypothetical protein BC941DRAFT_500713 [Chlamydoabsidia padenii]|nr:hypothetical protein BC941DRAFT_500713 [Chlamydoabsidia padenii]